MDTGHLRNKIAIQVGFRGDKMLQEKLMKGIFSHTRYQSDFFFNKGLERNEGNKKSHRNRREQKLPRHAPILHSPTQSALGVMSCFNELLV